VDRRAFLVAAAGAVPAARLVRVGRTGPGAALAGDPRLRELEMRVRGSVLRPRDSSRLVYNERFDGVRPLAVVLARDAADVRETVLWARRHGVRVSPRSGGHSYAGYSTTTGVVVDLSRLTGIAVGPGPAVRVGPGAKLIDVYATLAARGLAVPGGSCPSVGIGGLALGGGVGLASRKLGTTSDNVVSLRIVTGEGRLLECDARRDEDLYWACRGGGGRNFGIVTELVLRAHPVGDVATYFASWPWSDAEEVVEAWQRLAPGAPDELFSICSLATGAGEPVVRSLGQLFGTQQQLLKLVTPLRRVGAARLTSGTHGYLDAQLRFAGCAGVDPAHCLASQQRASFAAKSDYVRTPLPPRALRTMIEWVERRQPGPGSGSILLDSYGGAINRVAPSATAFVHRSELFSAQYLAYWGSPGAAAPSLRWLRGFHAALRPFVSGFSYQNYIDPELADWRHAYYGANEPRLVAVRKRRDPDRIFRFAQAV